jgi:hypothetical protein
MTVRRIAFLRAGLFVSLVCGPAAAQCPDWDSGFQTPGVDGVVHAAVVWDDGSGPALYVGGEFTSVAGVPALNIARFDGANWSQYGSGLASAVQALTVFDAGGGAQIYAGTSLGTGYEVTWWNGTAWAGADFNGAVEALRVFDEGSGPRLFAGGSFTSAGSVPALSVARWDGSAWSAVGTNLSLGVQALEVHDDGAGPRLYAAAGPIVARWNGSYWINLGTFDNDLLALRSFGGQLYAGGWFASVNGVAADAIARWNGWAWSALPVPWTPPYPWAYRVATLAVHDDGGGPALYAGGNLPDGVARWDGSTWTSVAPNSAGTVVNALCTYDDGGGAGLFAGGSFQVLETAGTPCVALRRAGAWSGLGTGLGTSELVYAFTVHDDGAGAALYAGGRFRSAGGVVVNRVARWTGAGWAALAGGIPRSGDVQALASFDDGSGRALYAGGVFSDAPVNSSALYRWSGGAWTTLPALTTAPGTQARVSALCAYDDGSGLRLIAGGVFTQAGGVAAQNIAAWDGTSWSAIGGGLPGAVRALAVYTSGGSRDLYAAVATPPSLFRWSAGAWTSIPLSDVANALVVHDDGSGPALYVAGAFTYFNGIKIGNVVRYDGTTATTVGGGAQSIVTSLAVHDEGAGPQLFAGGLFLSIGGVTASRVARWDGAAWNALGAGTDLPVWALGSHDDGNGADLWAGGTFRQAGASAAGFVSRWEGCGPGAPGVVYCSGDGTGTPCPCGNQGAPGNGCANSLNPAGAHLAATGVASLASDTVVLAGSGMPIVFALYFQGTGEAAAGLGVPFGDGLRCATGTVIRLGTKANVAGASQYPEPGDQPISQRGLVFQPGSRTYQCWYRNAASFCTPDTFNLTNALRILWRP